MSTIVTADELEAALSHGGFGRIEKGGQVWLDSEAREMFVPSVAEHLERVLGAFGASVPDAGLEISAATCASIGDWLAAVADLATVLQEQAAAVNEAVQVGRVRLGRRRQDYARGDVATAIATLGARIGGHRADGLRFTAGLANSLQEVVGEMVVELAEMELDVLAWRVRRRAGRGWVRDQRRDEEAPRAAPGTAPTGDPVSECLTAVAEFLGDYRESGVALADVTVVEIEALIRDMAGRARQLEAGAERRVDVTRAQRFGSAVSAALKEPGSNVEMFPVVRRSPPRDPAPAA